MADTITTGVITTIMGTTTGIMAGTITVEAIIGIEEQKSTKE